MTYREVPATTDSLDRPFLYQKRVTLEFYFFSFSLWIPTKFFVVRTPIVHLPVDWFRDPSVPLNLTRVHSPQLVSSGAKDVLHRSLSRIGRPDVTS